MWYLWRHVQALGFCYCCVGASGLGLTYYTCSFTPSVVAMPQVCWHGRVQGCGALSGVWNDARGGGCAAVAVHILLHCWTAPQHLCSVRLDTYALQAAGFPAASGDVTAFPAHFFPFLHNPMRGN